MKKRLWAFTICLIYGSLVFGQANGKLQIHFMNVGQGDGAILISPQGETVLFDNGVRNNCDKPLSYLSQLGVTKIDYHIASHYHDDHIGCTVQVFGEFPLQRDALDRGGTYHTATYRNYVTAVGDRRKTATEGTRITLDAGSQHPVRVEIVALNGNGIPTTNENDLSVVAVVRFGNFDAVIAGDLSGYKSDRYEDIETSVGPKVGQVEVYKVNHHGSRYSSNRTWLSTIKPKIGIVSAGQGNTHGHPTQECLEELHVAGVKTYWTEVGNGVQPEPGHDVVGGNIIVEITPGADVFSVTHSRTSVDNYPVWGATVPTNGTPKFAWSKRSDKYHFADCAFVANISPTNFEHGNSPPLGKTLHQGCPR